jgi:hypothetical protein
MHLALVAVAGAAILAAASPATAAAQDKLRDFCPGRPGLGTPPCTFDPGHGDVEVGLADWTLDRQPGSRSDTFLLGDTQLRYGLTPNLELQLGWTPYGRQRQRDSSGVSRGDGTGDVRLALRRNLLHPDGSGLSIAAMPYASVPTGGQAIGAGTWRAGMLLPVTYQLPHDFQVDFTGRIEAEPNASRRGRHLAYGGVFGLNVPVAKAVTGTFELSVQRALDPSGHATPVTGAFSLAWLAKPSLQLDLGANRGISGGAPDWELYAGIARRF